MRTLSFLTILSLVSLLAPTRDGRADPGPDPAAAPAALLLAPVDLEAATRVSSSVFVGDDELPVACYSDCSCGGTAGRSCLVSFGVWGTCTANCGDITIACPLGKCCCKA